MTDTIQVGSYTLKSRLLVGTGKYRDLGETGRAIEASGADVVTMAVRRTNLGQNPNEPNLLDVISPDRYTLLPNTAGCHTADDAVRTCCLARELLDGHSLVKLEVISKSRTLYPDVVETLSAARTLVDDGFEVMVYTSDDPLIAIELEAYSSLISSLDKLDLKITFSSRFNFFINLSVCPFFFIFPMIIKCIFGNSFLRIFRAFNV